MKRAAKMFAVIDIGNTNVKGVLFKDKNIVRRWSISTSMCLKPFFVQQLFISKLGRHAGQLSGVRIVSVVPKLNKIFTAVCKKILGMRPRFATPKNIDISLGGYSAREIGADRLISAMAAHAIHKRAVIVIGAGSALTFDAVDSKGRYMGGAIAPGAGMAATALHKMTAKLPLVKISRPRRAIGKSTRECISSGIFHGWAGLVRSIVREISKEMGVKPLVIATGGGAEIIAKSSGIVDEVRKDLLFEGLKILFTSQFSQSSSHKTTFGRKRGPR